MGRIHILTDKVANQIAAGEVVERPASVVKELLENSLDAGATRIRVDVEAGGKKLIQVVDNGCGMVRDDALLSFERHATSKIKDAEDLLQISTLGFRGEALPSIASVSRFRLETRAAPDLSATALASNADSGTVVEIHGGRILKVEEAGLPLGTSIRVQDLFFNIPARKKFLKAESTELSHIASLVTHYALAHPDKHFELHSATHALLIAPPVANHGERIYQVFGKDTLDQLLPVAAMITLERVGLPQPPPWRRPAGEDEAYEAPAPGELRVRGFVSRPEVQKLNRNSIFIFVNGRLIRDRLVQHAIGEAYRNILPSMVYPVVLLFLEMPAAEVDVNVHPSKTEVRFRQNSAVHDFVRDAVRATLMKVRPVPQFGKELVANPSATPGLSVSGSGAGMGDPTLVDRSRADKDGVPDGYVEADGKEEAGPAWGLNAQALPSQSGRLPFSVGQAIDLTANAALGVAQVPLGTFTEARIAPGAIPGGANCASAIGDTEDQATAHSAELYALSALRPLGQVKESFILAVNNEGLWIIDQHVAHERVLFEKVQKQRAAKQVESQRLLMPLLVELTPAQQAVFAEISDELAQNGFEVEPFGARTLAVKVVPAGLDGKEAERMLRELLEQIGSDHQALNMEMVGNRIAASIACHAAIKVNMPLTQDKMEWLLAELAKTEYPMTCPHGRPVVLRYSLREIERAFKRI